MKSIFKFMFTMIILVSVTTFSATAQKTGSGKITGQTFTVPEFDHIIIGGAMKATVSQSDKISVVIETDDNLFENIQVDVKNRVLEISARNIKNPSTLKAIISLPALKGLQVSGAGSFTGTNLFEGKDLFIEVSGAGKVQLAVKYDNISTTLSGASKLTLEGNANEHSAKLSGASKLVAPELETENTTLNTSGASNAKVLATNNLDVKSSGASSVSFDQQPLNYTINDQTYMTRSTDISKEYHNGDSVNVSVGNLKVQVIEGDTTRVNIGGLQIEVDEKGNVNVNRKKQHKFNGHWAGIELGLNGFLTPDFNMSFPASESYLDLRMEKSVNVNLNFYEQNIALNKSGSFGIVSGLGLSWNNYRFNNSTFVTSDSSSFKGYLIEGVSTKKSKLVNMYITLPVYFELQSKSTKTREKWHLAAGVVGGWRVSSHSKLYFNEPNKDFRLRDTETNQLLPYTYKSPGSTNRNITKDFAGFHQRPFKLDASVRAGWGIINLYANYSLTSMFMKDKGPELYPFALGICLSGW
ncbi:MAG: DUF2807 domain-containing protein [Bacteroidetes bacterium]|nr:DUF2807 domain-containing protein [Bacteroidota bacterium]